MVGGTVRTVGQTVKVVQQRRPQRPQVRWVAPPMSGIVGSVTGAAKGIQKGLSSGSKSTAAAALAIGAIGVAGLVDWPILLAVGGVERCYCRLNRTPEGVHRR